MQSITKSDVQTITVLTNPTRTYVSSSSGSIGSVHVFARHSHIEKEVQPVSSFIDSIKNDANLNASLLTVQREGRKARHLSSYSSAKFVEGLTKYLEDVNEQSPSARKAKVVEVIRFTPTFGYSSNTARKLLIKDVLNTYYRVSYPSAQWAYSNYNSLNFYTSSNVPEGSALLYPNIPSGKSNVGYVTGTYNLSGAFSFDFYINPRYTSLPNEDFKAGTIFHLSSSYALSLISGSAKDELGRPIGFRLQLQLSHSADVSPSLATQGTYPNDLTFVSDDNSLEFNKWHHVVVRWGTNLVNNGTGSFNINGVDKGTFNVHSATVNPRVSFQPPAVLSIGNYYEGFDDMSQFFANDPSTRDGLQILNDTTGVEEPLAYSFRHPLNAELHDVSIKRYYMSDVDISASASMGPKRIEQNLFALYIPPFFLAESPFRKFVGDYGGILQTPFFEVDGTTNDPFNVALSFGVGGHYINIENFLRDFASNVFPRVHLMSGTAIPYTTQLRSANDFLYDDPLVIRRNTLILPCDDGNFVPSYELLLSESYGNKRKAIDCLGVEEASLITLDNMIATSSLLFGGQMDVENNQFIEELIGFSPENPSQRPGQAYQNYVDIINSSVLSGTFDPGLQTFAPLTVFQRTQDPSSNQITIFDISNLYYGKRINPGSVIIKDESLSGSAGAIKITLKDDGYGNLYRCDAITSASTWNSVGNVYYDEGLILIKSPHLYFFGKDGYSLNFKGEQSIHTLRIDALAGAGQLNSSSNPNYKALSPTNYDNDVSEFVYVTGLNFHDDNYNVVMKAQLAQPIIKREHERIMFKVRYDM